MKITGKIGGILLALAVAVFLPGKVLAAEEGAHVLTYPAPEASAEAPYDYVTPFTVEHTVARGDGTRFFSGSCGPRVFRLLTDDGEAVTAYCADAAVGIQPGAHYRRINLEDSTFFNDATAGRLRAVIEGSYPEKRPEEIQEAANHWLRQRELPEITDLQSGEAILAAQIAIWKLAGGSGYTVNSLYSGVIDVSDCRDRTIHTGEISQKPTGYTAGNIESLYTYFCNLEPAAPSTPLISDASITRTVYSCVREEDGYTARVSVTVEAEIGDADSLTLTAACGDQVQEQAVTEAGEYAFEFSELPERDAVRLEIRGMQYGRDVFLFDAEGEREASQSLVGFHEGYLPVSCRRVLTPVPSSASAAPAAPVGQTANTEAAQGEPISIPTIQTAMVSVIVTACLLVPGNHKKI